MATSYKNILVTPNISNTADPVIQFAGGNTSANTDIFLRVYPTSNGTVSFEGSAGQLFSIVNDMSNVIFAVTDISGIPVIQAYANSQLQIYANGTLGTDGQVLTTNGTFLSWTTPAAAVNVAAQFSWTNTHSFAANLTIANTAELVISTNAGIVANGSLGTNGQVLTSNGTTVYWSTAAAGVNTAAQFSWTNTHSFAANVSMTGWLDVESVVETDATPSISAGTLTLDLNTAQVFDVSLNANITTLTINNVPATASKVVSFTLVLTADGTARTVAWPAAFRFPANTAPTITSTLNKRDIFVFFTTDNGTSWNAFTSGQNL
jgi:hypothetical protein